MFCQALSGASRGPSTSDAIWCFSLVAHRGYYDWPDDQALLPTYAALADLHHHPDNADAARLVKALISLGADLDPGQHTIRSLLRRIRTDRPEGPAAAEMVVESDSDGMGTEAAMVMGGDEDTDEEQGGSST